VFPNIVVMAPGDGEELDAMLAFALSHDAPCAIRYPKATAEPVSREGERTPLELGRGETIRRGSEGTIVCCGALLKECLAAAELLREHGLDVGVINARFAKPLDQELLSRALRESPFVVTVEEGTLLGGFGSAVLELASDLGIDTSRVRRLGIPDRFIEHGERRELLADLGLDAVGIARTCGKLANLPEVCKA
jgi:1-deoxy-D-xylulose-5-phosphate synthase